MNGHEVRRDYSALIERVLNPYDVWKATPTNWRARCPVHRGDNNTTFSIFENGRWRCFKCGAFGDMARLLMYVQRLTLQQARDYLGTMPVPFRSLADIQLPPKKRDNKPKLPYELLREATLAPYRRYCPTYLRGRGFSEESLRRYEIGYDNDNHKIVIPVRDAEARLVGLTYRLDFDTDRSQPAKYWHDNFAKSIHLYGFHLWRARPLRRLYLVEGQLDAVRMFQLGYAACAIMGSEISQEQVDVLVRHSRAESLVLAFDNDEAGFKARRNAITKLSKTQFGRELCCWQYPTKDPGELDETMPVATVPWTRCLVS